MYRKQVRRRRAVLVALVVACLMLISISISEAQSGPLHSIQNGLGSVFNPIQDGASRVLKPARDMVNWFDETFNARGENDKLKTAMRSSWTSSSRTRAWAPTSGSTPASSAGTSASGTA